MGKGKPYPAASWWWLRVVLWQSCYRRWRCIGEVGGYWRSLVATGSCVGCWGRRLVLRKWVGLRESTGLAGGSVQTPMTPPSPPVLFRLPWMKMMIGTTELGTFLRFVIERDRRGTEMQEKETKEKANLLSNPICKNTQVCSYSPLITVVYPLYVVGV
ncbi:hypothetical protein HHK36_025485 [Tetracentron sinense]|uniref:Uncharacterized protein n=1 Tax=Tetracentron sinense TaxID=13715 RepID=A0A834YIQ3_TETSI|nr:hypothetical protein HHK36_025485 [Tetracentron sinense]